MQIKFRRHFVPCFSYDDVTRVVTVDMRNFQCTHVRLRGRLFDPCEYIREDDCSRDNIGIVSCRLSCPDACHDCGICENFGHYFPIHHAIPLALSSWLCLVYISSHISTPGGLRLWCEVSSQTRVHRHPKTHSVWVIALPWSKWVNHQIMPTLYNTDALC